MSELAIIGGSGLTALEGLEISRRDRVDTPYGEPSGPLTYGTLCGKEVIFLARHGDRHTIPPHRINYRANLWALHQAGVGRIIAAAAVGGIRDDLPPGRIVIPNQLIDYTSSRDSTFFDREPEPVTHIDFTAPYDESLRRLLITHCRTVGIDVCEEGTYGVTQGPRLETRAEVDRMDRDGCTIVGMTAMPEAALARELDIGYAACAVVANWAAGRGGTQKIEMSEIEETLKSGIAQVRRVLESLITAL